MSTVSILLPTCNRPLLLRNALRSVKCQRAVKLVLEVIVVENGGSRESEGVCAEFPDLPISYILRDPPLKPEHSGRDLLSRARGVYTAILFDDDWWDPMHLESALSSLVSAPSAAAYYCSAFAVGSETSYITKVKGAFIPWFACSSSLSDEVWQLTTVDMVIAGLLGVGFFYPTLVCRTQAIAKCLDVYDYGNPYDTDRLLSVKLSRQGDVLFGRTPHAFFREHPNQETRRLQTDGTGNKWFQDTTRRIRLLAGELGIDLENEFRKRLAEKNLGLKELFRHSDHKCLQGLILDGSLGIQLKQDGSKELAELSLRSRLLSRLSTNVRNIVDSIKS